MDNQESISSNLFSSGTIRNRYHPISFHLEQSGIDLMQSLSSGTIRNGSPNRFSSGYFRNRSLPFFFSSGLIRNQLIKYFSIWINQESIFIQSFYLEHSGINLKIYFHLDQSEIYLFNLFSSGSIRNRSHPISFLLDQSGIDLTQSLFIIINQESISSNFFFIWNKQESISSISPHLDQSGIDLTQSLFIWINQESISSNLFSSGSIRNRFHQISSDQLEIDFIQSLLDLDQSGINIIQYFFIWNNRESFSSNHFFHLEQSGNRCHPISFHLDQFESISSNLFSSG
ncbi:hypothetical protein CEXT_408531 [Caerostris extrusa]|uniref:Maturase K n=1 Tax=Caerostris extrusa TaxID=172846 RepID=A0AAV4SRM4_CAEEX|nr:hypothetical protein CEXT_408531 [Caerostris extrusa]